MITRSSSHHSVAPYAAAFAAQGWSPSLPHPSFVSRRLKTNVARQSVLVSRCFDAVTGAAIALQPFNTARVLMANDDRDLIAGIQRP
jgi:hypothetical protein